MSRSRGAGGTRPPHATSSPLRGSPPRAGLGDEGAVVVEAALAIPALLVVALVLAWVVSLAAAYAGVGDTARSVARDLARGVSVAQAMASAQVDAPDTDVVVATVGDLVTVEATRELAPPLPFLSGAAVTLHQRVTVPREWS